MTYVLNKKEVGRINHYLKRKDEKSGNTRKEKVLGQKRDNRQRTQAHQMTLRSAKITMFYYSKYWASV